MAKVQAAVGRAHREFAPGCTSGACDLRIPMPAGGDKIGVPQRRDDLG